MAILKENNSLNKDYYMDTSEKKFNESHFESNGEAVNFKQNVCLHELIDAVAERQLDSVAVVFENKQLTYGELVKRANQLSNYLRNLGVVQETLVGLCLERSLDMIIGALAIQKAGGAYVPLDPTFPPSRIELVFGDAKAKVLLTEEKQLKMLNTGSARQVCIDSDWAKISGEKTTPPDSVVNSNHLAYVIYTSGSTGKPKGVQIEHHSVVNFLNSMRRLPGFKHHDTLLAVTTLSFDISILELYLPLTAGARVVILPSEKIADGTALIRAVEEHEITVMQATPATWRLMIEAGWKGNQNLKVLCGGEPMPADLARELIPKCHELWNMYGPTETTIWSTCSKITDPGSINIGYPIDNTDIYIFDNSLNPQPIGVDGELMIGGEGLARGYINLPELTDEKFIPHPFKEGLRLYRTGDIARYQKDGSIECLGRMDDQVKLHGFRIELGDIETHLSAIDGISRAVVMVREDQPGNKRLVAYYSGQTEHPQDILRQHLLSKLPEYMVPSVFVRVDKFPLTPNGKTDRRALPPPQKKRPLLANDYIAPRSELEKKLAACWGEVLEIDNIGVNDSFFDLGGTSLLAARMVSLWQKESEHNIPLVKLFQYYTISLLSNWMLQKDLEDDIIRTSERRISKLRSENRISTAQIPIAIVGMAGRFPGADNLEILWKNLCNGIESISVFEREELGVGIDESLRYNPDYIPARGIIDGAEYFDAAFFGISPREASVMDPQQRLFLELAYEALENAGYDPDRCTGPVGVYAGVGDNHYYSINLLSNPDIIKQAGDLVVEYGNEKDYIALRVAYALGLTGPAVSVNTACSTSLVAVDNAIQGLSNYDCDLALAGGIDICVPQKRGFLYLEGGIFTKDGHCKPFDADATGTMFCDGAGLVVLKRLDDAIAEGDTIYAIVRGSAKNSNGSRPASFLAPSVDGQAEVIALAQARAGISVESIGYIEAHGTGTPIGDPIEIEALSKVFSAKTPKKQFCYIGSMKGHIGHPTNAAGIAGLINAALVLHKEQIPPTLHFKKLNPKINLINTPFKIVETLTPFPRREKPRRSAVSSFGFGGTNVHAILEEGPLDKQGSPSRPMQLITVSAKTASALENYSRRLADYFVTADAVDFPDVAYTLIVGRKQLRHRKIVVASNPDEAAELLTQANPHRSAMRLCTQQKPPVVFLFGGQGSQYVNMGLNLYQDEPLFRTIIDECCEHLRPYLDQDLHDILYPSPHNRENARQALQNTCFTQSAVFTIEYAIARLWQSLGVEPAMMVGHSIGEFVAATLAGVFKLPDALKVAAYRGQLMQNMPKGVMLSVRVGAEEISDLLPTDIQIAAINAPSLCVLSGPREKIEDFQVSMESQGIVSRPLLTSHAFHSEMMDPILDPLRKFFNSIKLKKPENPFISTVTGLPITESQACDPEYWVMHARKTVCFSSAMKWLVNNGYGLFLECGPRATMSTLARQHMTPDKPVKAIPSLISVNENSSEWEAFLMALGSLWIEGVDIDWNIFYTHEQRRRVPLPTYPFERKRYWVDPVPNIRDDKNFSSNLPKIDDDRINKDEIIIKSNILESPVLKQASGVENIKAHLMNILARVWGCDPDQLSETETFLAQGFDSLSLTQVAISIYKELQIKVTFEQLADQLSTVVELTDYIHNHLPEIFKKRDIDVEPKRKDILQHDYSPNNKDSDSLSQIYAELQALTKQVEILNSRFQPTNGYGISASIISSVKNDIVQVPLTDAQREIWLSCHLDENASKAYNESFLIMLYGDLRKEALDACIQELFCRHDSLRTTFSPDGEKQFIKPKIDQTISFYDLSGTSDMNQKGATLDLVVNQNKRPFDLINGPLSSVQLIKLSESMHALHFTSHHLVMDGWSAHVLMIELGKLYVAKNNGQKHDLAPAMQYQEYVDWYFQPESEAERKEAEQYWVELFKDLPPAIELPSDNPRPAQRSYSSEQARVSFDAEKYKSMKQVCSELKCTLFQFLFCSFNIWLHQLTGFNEIVIGVPMAGHLSSALSDKDNIQQLVGHCVNLVPIRLSLQSDLTFKLLINEVKKQFLKARSHDNLSYANLIEKLNPPRNSGQLPLVSISFNLSDDPALDWGGLKVEAEYPPKPYIFFDLMVNVRESSEKIEITCDFNTDLFKSKTIERWLLQWQHIIDVCLSKSDSPIGKLPLISDKERQMLLIDWNSTMADYPSDKCLHQLIEKQTNQTPDSIAAQFENKTLSFRALDERTNKLANYLKSLGVGPNKLVGVFIERSLEMLIALLGVLKAGGAYVPLDPAYPAERISYILEDAAAIALVTQESLLHSLDKISVPIISLDSEKEKIERQDPYLLDKDVNSDNLAYVIYTSGSTGKPKGVQIQHRAIVNFLWSMQHEPGLTSKDVLLAVTTPSFDIAALELFLPLIAGARVVITPREKIADGMALISALKTYKITIMQATPATWRIMLAAGWKGDPNLKILCGGEPLPKDLAKQLLPRCLELWNMYGPTETTVWSTCAKIDDVDNIHIGRPITNTDVYIVNKDFKPVPVGITGELLIGGDGLAKCYHKRPELTKEKFIDHPIKPGMKIFRTGDVARYRPDGTIDCLGRMDNQVKIRGYRIELGEIEEVLSQNEQVANSVVVAREDLVSEKQLVAYIVSKDLVPLKIEDLREHLSKQLPNYMIPSTFMFLKTLPLTPNGKIDRKALPQPEKQNVDKGIYQPPDGKTEKTLAKFLISILNIPRVGRNDSFFDLGGHSILAVKYFIMIEDHFGIRLPLAKLFESPSIKLLGLELDKKLKETKGWQSLVPIKTKGSRSPLFLVHGAEGNVLIYRTLSLYLGEDQPVYGLQAAGLDGSELGEIDFENVAPRYIEEIRKVQPNGPYLLGGYCLGGTIALEMAHQLQAMGESVSFVAMFETYNIKAIQWPQPILVKACNQILNFYYHLLNLIAARGGRWAFFKEKLKVEIVRVKISARAALAKTKSLKERKNYFLPHLKVREAFDNANERYEIKPYNGRVAVFLTKKRFIGFNSPKGGWGDAINNGLEVYTLPINPHGSMIEPYVRDLAAMVRILLDKSENVSD